jgi:DNA mismatch repair protein MutL
MPIRLLDAFTASQIAAGEVVERPASVVKELVENAVDAGASEIRVEIREGGKREIRVSDNGGGIPADEVELAFQRHATSKLQTAADLFDVHTLGFRGEALPSVASVAQVVCTTRTADAETGVELRVAGGEIQGRAPRGGTPGTTFVVKNLFYNAPVRLKFLRSEASEAAQISAVVSHYALAYPNIRWTLLIDGRLALQTPGSDQLLDAIIELYGLDIARQLIPVEDAAGSGDQATRIHGFISQPSLHRSARSSIHLFVNRRWVQARGQLAFVLEEAYHTLLMKGRHPLAILNVDVEPGAVDVNVHPTKSEVKFLYQSQVFALLGRAVRSALSEYTDVQAIDLGPASTTETLQRRIELRQAGTRPALDRQLAPWEPPPAGPQPRNGPVELDEELAHAPPWESLSRTPVPAARSAAVVDEPAAVENVGYIPVPSRVEPVRPSPRPEPAPARPEQTSLGIVAPAPSFPAPVGAAKLPPLRVVGQVGETYIVAEAPDGMYLVDQHAAHERVVYERLMRGQGAQPLERQSLLMPVTVDLPPAMVALLAGHLEELEAWGFAMAMGQDGRMEVTAVPAGLREGEVGPALLELGEHLQQAGGSTPADWREQALTTIACHSAVRAGQALSHEEMRQLLQQLERCALPRTCPHGRPTALLLSQSQLERQFGRKG